MEQASAQASLEQQLDRLRHEFAASEARFFQVFQLAPIAMSISTLSDGCYLHVNAALLEASGYSHADVIGRTARDLSIYADSEDFVRIRDILERDGSLRGLELRLRGKRGDVRTVLLSGDTIEFGGQQCLLTASVDITERKAIEASLAASEARYRAAVITGRIAAWETDMVSRTRIWTVEGMELFGLNLPGGRGQVLGPNDEFYNALHPDDKHMMKQFHRTADREDSYPCEYRIVRPDGRELWVSGRGRVVARGPDGKAQRVANIVVDITERKKAEAHAQMLMGELVHRSKNLLTVVQAIAGQTARASGSLRVFQEKFGLRLQALAASHDLLSEQHWRGASLRQLVCQQLLPFAEIGPRLTIQGPELLLAAAAAQTIGLALHELATNATKYGAWSLPAGTVAISWDLKADPQSPGVRVRWVERGGPPVAQPARTGFGHVVCRDMVATHGMVTTTFDPKGFEWEVLLHSNAFIDA